MALVKNVLKVGVAEIYCDLFLKNERHANKILGERRHCWRTGHFCHGALKVAQP